MARKVKFLLMVRSKSTRDSLAALLASIPEAEMVPIYSGIQEIIHSTTDFKADMVILEGNPRQPEVQFALQKIRLLQPETRTMLLVEPMLWNTIERTDFADLVYPLNIKAGEMLTGIMRMVG
jgi:hypothetical protein